MADNKPNEANPQRPARAQRTRNAYARRLKRMREHGLKPPISPHGENAESAIADFTLDCGWGRLIFGQTFSEPETIIAKLQEELPERRDIAVYIRNPHVLLANAPQDVFLDPSHTFRLDLSSYRASPRAPKGFFIRRLTSQADAEAINRIYAARGMVPVPPEFFWSKRDARSICYFVAEDETTGDVLGTVTGVDHHRAFNDPEHGSSLWCLAVDPQTRQPGAGEALVRRLIEYFIARGASYLDLSVLHDNEQAIALYEKLGFERVPFFSVKRKNPINETLFTGPEIDPRLNPYAKIIVREARRRGIQVKVTDAEGGFFRLSYGGRSIHCRESLSELTTAVAMSICDDKAVTRRMVHAAGVRVPEQISAAAPPEEVEAFLNSHGKVVVKPARGEQGRGIAVGLSEMGEIKAAVLEARKISDAVLLEECIEGMDLRLVVINYRLVAAAVRRPAFVVGDGEHTIRELIKKQSRRRAAGTGGESKIPLDAETERTIRQAGYDYDTVLPVEEELQVRRTANLHTGGTLHDVTGMVHPALVEAGVKSARAIEIPVVGIDLMVKSPRFAEYAFIEANERPGLANHEPQPTAERFIDLLFPLSIPAAMRQVLVEATEPKG
jgi:GNAT-family acetyltransferase (TIGR03103 family)